MPASNIATGSPSSERVVTLEPDAHGVRLAAESCNLLDQLAQTDNDLTLTVTDDQGSRAEARIPGSILRFLISALAEVANGNAISMLPLNTELTTQQAADLLNVSRPYLVGLLDQGCMPFRKVGNQRRVSLRNLLNYKARNDEDRRAALDELVRQAQELSFGYDE